ncbi:Battenin [Aphelenchoides fujianensis]|nr:Battenin [Aphelenchoides fujianensis]
MANSFAFIVMLAAANDLMRRPSTGGAANSTAASCEAASPAAQCAEQPLGAVVLANVLPAAAVKLLVPFALHRLPLAALLVGVCAAQAASYLLVAFSASIPWALAGVGFAALSSGLGDVCFLASIISAWSSGTGASGLLGSLAYAALTEPRLGGLTPQQALLAMLVVPALLFCTYFGLLTPASTVYAPSWRRPRTWLVPRVERERAALPPSASAARIVADDAAEQPGGKWAPAELTAAGRLRAIVPLLPYVLPLTAVYLLDYSVQQGMATFLVFDCRRGFGLSPAAAYRWIQAAYCCGAFVARSGAHLLRLPAVFLALFPLYELLNAGFFFAEATRHFLPHIGVVFALVFVEGAVGGASYANTYFRIHTEVPPARREFSLAIATLSDVVGIALAGVATLPLQTAVCRSLAQVA